MIRREAYGFRCFLQLVPLHRPFTEALSHKMTQKTPVLHPDHPMYTEAVEAMKRYHEALAYGCSAGEAERLRQIAESQFQAVNEYQLKALGSVSRRAH